MDENKPRKLISLGGIGCVFATLLIALWKLICQSLSMTGKISSEGKISWVCGNDKKVACQGPR